MDDYKDSHRTRPVIVVGEEDPGWRAIADQELSFVNLLDFSLEMTQAGVRHLSEEVGSDSFYPDKFSWRLDSVHEFHHMMLAEARKCGLDVEHLSSWLKAREEKSTRSALP